MKKLIEYRFESNDSIAHPWPVDNHVNIAHSTPVVRKTGSDGSVEPPLISGFFGQVNSAINKQALTDSIHLELTKFLAVRAEVSISGETGNSDTTN